LVAASATGAFADLNLQIGAGANVPNSWALSLSAEVTGGSLASSQFNEIRLYRLSAANITTGGMYAVASVPFEDFKENPVVGADDSHKAIQGFLWIKDNAVTANTWAQTIPVSPVSGQLLVDQVRATGNTVTGPTAGMLNQLNFTVFFDGNISNGAHFLVEFWNAGSFVGGYDVKYILRNGQTLPDSEYFPTLTPIPLPPAVWSGLAMMAGFGAFLAKRRRDRKALV
jgi:hypothetical protein